MFKSIALMTVCAIAMIGSAKNQHHHVEASAFDEIFAEQTELQRVQGMSWNVAGTLSLVK